MTTRMWILLRLAFVSGAPLSALLLPAMAYGMRPPSYGGQIVAEPIGLKEVVITRETLTIDLRPLAANEPARIEAVYHLNNLGEERVFEMVFAADSERTAEFKVWLGDEPLVGVLVDQKDPPASWQPPKQTPGIHDGQGISYLQYGRRKVAPIAFTVRLAPGAKQLKVSYPADTSMHRQGTPTVYRQFAYLLAPARECVNFGGIDITIQLPEGWQAAWTPKLTREGDVLRGSFAELPADAIAVTIQALPGEAYESLVQGGQILLGFTALAGAIVCFGVVRSRARQQKSVWLISLYLSFAWGVAIFIVGLLAIHGPRRAIPAHQESDIDGPVFATIALIFISPLVPLVGIMLCTISAAISGSMARKD